MHKAIHVHRCLVAKQPDAIYGKIIFMYLQVCLTFKSFKVYWRCLCFLEHIK